MRLITLCLFIFSLAAGESFSQQLEGKINTFKAMAYNDNADIEARKITESIMLASPAAFPTEDEKKGIVKAFLELEAYYAFNASNGVGQFKTPRFAYDFLSKLNKAQVIGYSQRLHLTTLWILSVAAQEYLFNPKSTVDDLRKHFFTTSQFSLYRKDGNLLDIRNLVVQDQQELLMLTYMVINDELHQYLTLLLNEFKNKKLGQIYAFEKGFIDAKIQSSRKIKKNISAIPQELREKFNLEAENELALYDSVGDGQCGFFSQFIACEGRSSGIAENNTRFKVSDALVANENNPFFEGLYKYFAKDIKMKQADFVNAVEAVEEGNDENEKSKLQEYNLKKALMEQQLDDEITQKTKEFQQFVLLHLKIQDAIIYSMNRFKEKIKKQEFQAPETPLEHLPEGYDGFSKEQKAFKQIGIILEKLISKKILDIKINDKTLKAINNGTKKEKDVAFRSLARIADQILDRPTLRSIKTKIQSYRNYEEKYNEYINDLYDLFDFIINFVDPTGQSKNALHKIAPKFQALNAAKIQKKESLDVLRSQFLYDIGKISKKDISQFLSQNFKNSLGNNGFFESANAYAIAYAFANNMNIITYSVNPTALEIHANTKDDGIYQTLVFSPQPKDNENEYLTTVVLTSPTAKTIFLKHTGNHYMKYVAPEDDYALGIQMREDNAKGKRNEWLYGQYPKQPLVALPMPRQ